MPKIKLILPAILAGIILGGAGCSLFTENTLIDLKNEDKKEVQEEQNMEEKNINEVNTLDWEMFRGFKFPKNWFAWDRDGARSSGIYFSDGGDLNNEDLSYDEIKRQLDHSMLEEKIIRNECSFRTWYNGDNKTYGSEKINRKEDDKLRSLCDKLLIIMDMQVKSVFSSWK